MTLHPCTNCHTIWLVTDYYVPFCPRCKEPLGVRREKMDKTAGMNEVASLAVHGKGPRVRRRWSIE